MPSSCRRLVPSRRANTKTKTEAIAAIKRAIDVHLDYAGDTELFVSVERLVNDAIHKHRWPTWPRGIPKTLPPTAPELCALIDRMCDLAKIVIRQRYAKSEQAVLAEKLRQMTVENGCTPAEAEAARIKLQKL
jgi:hypothetical protein